MALEPLYLELRSLVRGSQYDDGLAKKGRTIRVVADELRAEFPSNLKLDLQRELPIKALVLLAECYDYYGQFTKSAWAAELGRDILSTMDSTRRLQRDELSQAKIRLAVAYARSQYRSYCHDAAEKLLNQCRDYVNRYIVTRSFPNYGTLGEIAYTLGRIHRQQQSFDSAISEFNAAVELYNARALWKRHRNEPEIEAEETFSAHKVATIVALGLSWCNYTRGALTVARDGNLIPAQMLLRNSGDILNRAYADVVFALTGRALAGQNVKRLKSLFRLVKDAKELFEDYEHDHYVAGAALELALIALALGDTKEARSQLRAVAQRSSDDDFRWTCSAMIVRSRIYRQDRKPSRAREIASEALELAQKQKERLAEIDALIARSEAHRAERNFDLGIKDLLRALDLNRPPGGKTFSMNPKVHGICHLHLVQHYLARKRLPDALASFAEWKEVSRIVEHANIRALASDLRKKLDGKSVLVIDVRDHTKKDILKYRKYDNMLREFLFRQATLRARTQEELGSLLGITPPTRIRWSAEFDDSPSNSTESDFNEKVKK